MPNKNKILNLDGSNYKKILIQELKDMTYKEIMTLIIENATEKGCHQIFVEGGINMCPSDVFNYSKLQKEKEDLDCCYSREDKRIDCTKCWAEAVRRQINEH